MTLLPVLLVFSNAQAGKGLRRAAHVFFPLALLQLSDSALAKKSAWFNCFEAIGMVVRRVCDHPPRWSEMPP